MSALGQKQTLDRRPLMSALPPKADIKRRSAHAAHRQLGDISRYPSRLVSGNKFAAGGCKPLVGVNRPTLVRDTSGAGALHPVFEAPAVSMSARGRRRFPLRAPGTQIRESQ
jgi:hypothetical protein